MRRTIGGTILLVTGCIFSPCCLPITLPFLLAALGGTAAGGWLLAHENLIGLIAAIYGLGALGLGGFLLFRRHQTTGRRDAQPALRDLLEGEAAPALCRLDAPCDCCCDEPQQVPETPRGRNHSVLPILSPRTEDEAPLVHQKRR